MNYKSSEIEQILFDKQIQTYTRIMDLINREFDNMDEERLSILLRNCIDMFGDIQIQVNKMKIKDLYKQLIVFGHACYDFSYWHGYN